MKPNLLKERLKRGEVVFGAWIETGSATNTEILGRSGFDFLVIDLEHGEGDFKQAVDMMRAAEASGTPAVVRAPWNDPVYLKRILDLGAQSLMIPQIETVEEAEAAIRACRYPPAGRRGYAAPIVRASAYGKTADYVRNVNEQLLLILQLESAEAVGRAAEICAVEGLDVPFLGVNDMAGSIGCLEQLDLAEVRTLVGQAEQAMKASGKPMGTVPSAGANWQSLVKTGYQFLPVANDVSMLRDAAETVLAAQRRFRGLDASAESGGVERARY